MTTCLDKAMWLYYYCNMAFDKIEGCDMKAKIKKMVYGTSIGVNTRNTDSIIKLLKAGLPVSAFDKLQVELDVTAQKLASITNIAHRTLARRKKEGRLKTDESERLLRIARLFDRASDVFEEKKIAKQWFKSPNKGLGGKTPLEYADTEPGAQEIYDLLGRLEHGVFS